MFLTKKGLTLEMGALKLVLDAERCSAVIFPKALPTYPVPSLNKTRPKVSMNTSLIYQAW